MRTELSQIHQRLGTTFIYVTHDQTEAMTMADRICVMKDGLIQQVDTPQTLYDKPVNIFVAGFIGTPQMNFMDVDLTKDGFETFEIKNNVFKIENPPAILKQEDNDCNIINLLRNNKYINEKNFGNARFIRNVYEKTIIKHASNIKDKKADR